MEFTQNCNNKIHTTLQELIDRKSMRDGKIFTIYQLAKAINMPHSILIKLIHDNPNKRVKNPRTDTLTRIVNFFKQDGFNITIDELLTGFRSSIVVSITEQNINAFTVTKSIAVYSMSAVSESHIGMTDIKLTQDSENIIGFLSDEDIKPMFKKGSIFIVDTALKPEHDMLVAVKIHEHQSKIIIRKFCIVNHKKILTSYDNNILPFEISSESHHHIVGVVVQVNAKT